MLEVHRKAGQICKHILNPKQAIGENLARYHKYTYNH